MQRRTLLSSPLFLLPLGLLATASPWTAHAQPTRPLTGPRPMNTPTTSSQSPLSAPLRAGRIQIASPFPFVSSSTRTYLSQVWESKSPAIEWFDFQPQGFEKSLSEVLPGALEGGFEVYSPRPDHFTTIGHGYAKSAHDPSTYIHAVAPMSPDKKTSVRTAFSQIFALYTPRSSAKNTDFFLQQGQISGDPSRNERVNLYFETPGASLRVHTQTEADTKNFDTYLEHLRSSPPDSILARSTQRTQLDGQPSAQERYATIEEGGLRLHFTCKTSGVPRNSFAPSLTLQMEIRVPLTEPTPSNRFITTQLDDYGRLFERVKQSVRHIGLT